MDIIPQNYNVQTLSPISIDFLAEYGLPNSLREGLLGLKMGDAALLLDAIFLTGLKTGQPFTIAKLTSHLVSQQLHISTGLIRRALSSGIFPQGKIRKKQRGRPEMVYRVPDLMSLVNQYAGGKWTVSDPLDRADLVSLKDYKMALHREFIRRRPGNYSRAFLAQRLGVGKRSTRNYDRRLGITVTERLPRRRIDQLMNWQDVVRAGRKYRDHIVAVYHDGRDEVRLPLVVGAVWQYVREAAIYIETRLTNHYCIDDDAYQLHKPMLLAY